MVMSGDSTSRRPSIPMELSTELEICLILSVYVSIGNDLTEFTNFTQGNLREERAFLPE